MASDTPPKVNKNGSIHASTGSGPLKEIRRPAQRATVDYLDAEKWGLSPEGGFKWTVPDDVSAEKISENEGKTHVPSEGAGSENSGISENSLGFDNSKFSENSGIVQNSENSVI